MDSKLTPSTWDTPIMFPTSTPLFSLAKARDNWGWFLVLGLLLIVIGMIAITTSCVATIATVLIFGWLLIITGVMEIITAAIDRDGAAFFLHLLFGLLDIAVGAFFISRPGEAAMTLTLLAAIFFVVTGAFRVIAALTHRFPSWGWALFSGIVTIVLGIMLWNQWPYSGLWFIGLCVGIELLFRGWFWTMLGLWARRLPKGSAAAA